MGGDGYEIINWEMDCMKSFVVLYGRRRGSKHHPWVIRPFVMVAIMYSPPRKVYNRGSVIHTSKVREANPLLPPLRPKSARFSQP